jgi:hypothetical protein
VSEVGPRELDSTEDRGTADFVITLVGSRAAPGADDFLL